IPGDLFAIGTILAPQHKLQFFNNKEWGATYQEQYRQSFEQYLEAYKQRVAPYQPTPAPYSSISQSLAMQLEIMLEPTSLPQDYQNNELTRYLDSGKCPASLSD